MIGVGGTGAKLTHALLHLSAAGLVDGDLCCLLVDADGNNGNGNECSEVRAVYEKCKGLKIGGAKTRLFSSEVTLDGPWKPAENDSAKKLGEFFHYSQKKGSRDNKYSLEADLLELLYDKQELEEIDIAQGFRGRPAIGAAIFAERIDFKEQGQSWYKLIEQIRHAAGANSKVPVLFAGSIFGGTGAAGVPTIFQVARKEIVGERGDSTQRADAATPEQKDSAAAPSGRMGMTLMLPYFTFEKVPGEAVQADPSTFPEASVEALTYYHERQFLGVANSMYALGEVEPAKMPVPQVGGKDQRNPAHFLELVAALGAIRFFAGKGTADKQLSLAVRKEEKTLEWEDLPFHDPDARKTQTARLKQMILFAVIFRYVYWPWIAREAADDAKLRRSSATIIRKQVIPYKVKGKDSEGKEGSREINSQDLKDDLGAVNEYLGRFLHWVQELCTSHPGVTTQLVNTSVFAGGWDEREFNRKGLFLGAGVKPSLGHILDSACEMKLPDDDRLQGTGYVIRALYDACNLY